MSNILNKFSIKAEESKKSLPTHWQYPGAGTICVIGEAIKLQEFRDQIGAKVSVILDRADEIKTENGFSLIGSGLVSAIFERADRNSNDRIEKDSKDSKDSTKSRGGDANPLLIVDSFSMQGVGNGEGLTNLAKDAASSSSQSCIEAFQYYYSALPTITCPKVSATTIPCPSINQITDGFERFTSCLETIGSNLALFGGNFCQVMQFIGGHVGSFFGGIASIIHV